MASGKSPMMEVQEKVDILSTSIEVINQKLANQLNPIAKTDPVLLKQVSMIDNKIGFLYNTIKKIQGGAGPDADAITKTLTKFTGQVNDSVQSMGAKVDQDQERINQIIDLQKQQIQVLTEQNKAINQHISDINDRLTDLVETNKDLMKAVASSIKADVALAKSETKKAEEKINRKK